MHFSILEIYERKPTKKIVESALVFSKSQYTHNLHKCKVNITEEIVVIYM